MTTRVIAVVGHVDHGKTSLVKALTGTDTDTLAEERRRGLTISLGFAPYTSPSGVVNLIDAPGHTDFLRTTVSGVSGADAILLVISAVEGVQAQTLEHLEIARLLGIQSVIVAITKSDIASLEQITDLKQRIAALLSSGAYCDTEIVTCSVGAKVDLVSLKRALDRVLIKPAERQSLAGFYLPVDRAFTIKGAGTVVTGTLLGGQVDKDQASSLQPRQLPVSIRGLQVNGQEVESAETGSRIAVNLRGVSAKDISKGDVLCRAGDFATSKRFDVVLYPAAHVSAPPKHMEEVMVLHGAGHASARLRLLKPSEGSAQSAIYAQLEFTNPQISYAGQRCLLRRPSTAENLAGGKILDPVAKPAGRLKRQHRAVLKAAEEGDPLAIAKALSARDGGAVMVCDVINLARQSEQDVLSGLQVEFEITEQIIAFDRSAIETVKESYLQHMTALHAQMPAQPRFSVEVVHRRLRGVHPEMVKRVELGLQQAGLILAKAGQVSHADYDPMASLPKGIAAEVRRLDEELREMALLPVNYRDLLADYQAGEQVVDVLAASGKLLKLYNHSLGHQVLLHTEAVSAARDALTAAFPPQQIFRPSEARALLKTNRKVIIPLLEYFDGQGVTVKSEDGRCVAG